MALFDEIAKINKVNKLVDREIGKTANLITENSFSPEGVVGGPDPNVVGPPAPQGGGGAIAQQPVPQLPQAGIAPLPQQAAAPIPAGQIPAEPGTDFSTIPPEAQANILNPDAQVGNREQLNEAIAGFSSRRDNLLEVLGGVFGAITEAQFGTNLGNIVAPNYFANRAQEAQQLQQASQFFGAGGAQQQQQQKQTFALQRQEAGAKQDLASDIFKRGVTPEQVFRGSTAVTTGGIGAPGGARAEGQEFPGIGSSLQSLTDFIRKDITPQLEATGGLPSLDQAKKRQLFGDVSDQDIEAILSGDVNQIIPLLQEGKLGGAFGGRLVNLVSDVNRSINPAGVDLRLSLPPEARKIVGEQLNKFTTAFPDLLDIDTAGLPADQIITTTGAEGEQISNVDPFSETGQQLIESKVNEISANIESLEKTRGETQFVSGPRGGSLDPETTARLRKESDAKTDRRIADLRKQQSQLDEFKQARDAIKQFETEAGQRRVSAFSGETRRQQIAADPDLAKRLGAGRGGTGTSTRTTKTSRDVKFERAFTDPQLNEALRRVSSTIEGIR